MYENVFAYFTIFYAYFQFSYAYYLLEISGHNVCVILRIF